VPSAKPPTPIPKEVAEEDVQQVAGDTHAHDELHPLYADEPAIIHVEQEGCRCAEEGVMEVGLRLGEVHVGACLQECGCWSDIEWAQEDEE